MARILAVCCSILLAHLGTFSAASPVESGSLAGLPPPSEGLVKYVPEGRNAIKNQPLYFSTFQTPYATAVDYCRAANMKIVKIETEAKQQLVAAAMAREGSRSRWNRWIGLIYYNGWFWSDGTGAAWINCASCTTSTSTSAHFIYGDPEFPQLNRWAYTAKTTSLGFICE